MRHLAKFSLLFIAVLAPTNGYAQWAFQTQENAFDDTKTMHLALTVTSTGYALGLRCQGGEKSVVFMTPEKSEDVSILNSAQPMLLLRVDKNTIQKFPVYLQVINNKITGTVEGEVDIDAFFKAVKSANSRISAAFDILGQTMHATNFSVSGSTQSVGRLQSKCE